MSVGSDPFGRAVRDHYVGQQDKPLIHRDGDEWGEHPIEENYFGEFCSESSWTDGIEQYLHGPLLDIGAGAGKHALYFQDHFDTVAIEVSEYLVETMDDRGVEDARHVDMFNLRETFDSGRFQSALANGTQLGLVRSLQGLRRFFGDLAYVTGPDATAVLNCYDPTLERTKNMMGYREDPTPGLAYRVLHFEYEGDAGETLLFRLFSPDRIREATVGTGWDVEEIWRVPADEPCQLEIALTKQ